MFRLVVVFLFIPVMVAAGFGVVDTIGGTYLDDLTSGPAWRMLVNTPGRGLHAIWMYAPDTDTLFPHRNMRYNFYDQSTDAWNWSDPDFMVSGQNVFPVRTGYGNIDIDTTGAAVISAHHTTASSIAPILARDTDAGAGIFDYSPGEPVLDGYAWPCVGVGTNGYYHLAMMGVGADEGLYWSRMTAWPGWDSAVSISPPGPLPPTHNIATSKVPGSNKVCITWVATPAVGHAQMPGFFRESTDGGDTWQAPVELGYPPGFHPGSETVPSFHVSSLFPLYDTEDNLHIVGNVAPCVRDTGLVVPGQIWHWCPANPDTWNLIRIASPDSWNAPCGRNAMVCDRPSLGQDRHGDLLAAWEEFDGVDVETTTNRLRADIWCSCSHDNGVTWWVTKVTDGGEVSNRFPSILNPIGDTVLVEYLIDQVAGFWGAGEGPATENPVVVHRVYPDGLADGKNQTVRLRPTATIARGVLVLDAAGSRQQTGYRAELLDVSGRKVMDLRVGDNDIRQLAPGVHFIREAQAQAQAQAVRKVVITR